MSMTIENYCLECKQVARDDCEDRGHIVGTLGQDSRTATTPEPPAPDAGRWRYRETAYSAEIIAGELTLKPHWTGPLKPEVIQATMRQVIDDHHLAALVPSLIAQLEAGSDGVGGDWEAKEAAQLVRDALNTVSKGRVREMITFLQIETRGGNLVAVFDRGYRQWEPTGDGGSRYDDGTFCLNEPSLRARIANVEAGLGNPDRDASVERHALTTMEAAAYYNGDVWANRGKQPPTR